MPPRTKRTKAAISFRLRPEVKAAICRLSKRENISQARFVELCVDRFAKDVSAHPFPTPTR